MNILFGKNLFGRFIFGGSTNDQNGGTAVVPTPTHEYYPGQYVVYAYAADGTRTAMFGSGIEDNALSSLSFSITSTGCGDCTLTFKKLPSNVELTYMQRIDIHLFGDVQPWYSGYILSRPVEGTTESTYTFKAHGYYNRLESMYLFQTYENMDVADIVRDIARQAERSQDLIYNETKIITAGYTVQKLVFDGTSVKNALKTLADFAIDFVYGVDEYRNLYFKPRNASINEQARLTVGVHIASYVPSWDVSKVVNWARIKGGNINDEGEQWLCTVEDAESQALCGKRQAVWTLPEAQAVEDAERWGANQIQKYKDPVRSAKVSGVRLECPLQDGTFNVRHMTTDGEAEIRTLSGDTYTYPINKISYTVSASKGISADLQLGEPVFALDRYLLEQERNYKAAVSASAQALKQLATKEGA
mgnify:FL=1